MTRIAFALLLPLLLVFPRQAFAAEKLHCPARTKNEDENKATARQFFVMGGAYFKTQDYRNAVLSYECVLTFVPYSVVSRYHLAKSHDALGNYSKARVQYQLIVANDSDEAKALAPEIQKRLKAIQGLSDKAAAAEEKEEMLGATDAEAARQQEKIAQLERELTELKKKMEAGQAKPEETRKVAEGIDKKKEELERLRATMKAHKALVQEANAQVLQKDPALVRGAIAKYLKALELHEDVRLFYNIGTGFERLGEYDQARTYFQRFLDNLDKVLEFDAARRDLYRTKAQGKIEKIDQLQRALQEESEEKTSLRFDESASSKPTDERPKRPVPADGGLTSRWWFWGGLVLTTALAGSTAYLGYQALTNHDQLKEEWSEAQRDRTNDYKLYTDISLGAAVVSGVVLLTAIWLHEPAGARPVDDKGTSGAWLLPSCSGSHCMLTLGWSF